ncbi:hypothetical protein [Sorangium sp. So ce131]|uniref:hypothetical protein n=1 Tax=Sorangium sp. So ce131 TaxID=3133282 RepID=UPI003F62BBDB
MAEAELPEVESTTAWHPMLVALLELYLPEGWQLLPEFLLTRLPQRVDIVVVRRVQEAAGTARKIRSILAHLRPHTLIEHKGPTDDLEPGDALTLLGYAAQYMRMAKVGDPAELCLMVVCDRIPSGFVEQVERLRGSLVPTGGGLWRGELAGLLLHGVETRDACRGGATERLLYAFSRAYLTVPEGILPLDAEEARVYTALYQQVEQFRKKRGNMAIRDIDAARKSYEEVFAEIIDQIPPELRVRGLTPEQRLLGLTVEQILDALPPEAREQLEMKLRH